MKFLIVFCCLFYFGLVAFADDLKFHCNTKATTCGKLGDYYYKNGDNFFAKDNYNKACGADDYYSCYMLGVFYEKGLGTRQNLAEAVKFYAKGCDKGNGNYQACKGFERLDYKTYNKNVKKDCDSATKCLNGGIKNYNSQNYFAAKDDFYLGCLVYSDAISCLRLGQMYFDGSGVRQNIFDAIDYYEKACNFGLSVGCEYLSKTMIKVMDFLQKDCNKGNGDSCYQIAIYYAQGKFVKQDFDTMQKYLGRACYELKNQIACDDLAQVEQELKKLDAQQKQNKLETNCTISSYTCGELGDYYYINGDNLFAKENYDKACVSGDLYSCYMIGMFYEKGLGVERKLNEAIKFYTKGCNNGNGNNQACKGLERLSDFKEKQSIPDLQNKKQKEQAKAENHRENYNKQESNYYQEKEDGANIGRIIIFFVGFLIFCLFFKDKGDKKRRLKTIKR